MTPDGNPAQAQVVGVLSSFSWAGGAGDLLNLKFNVSTATKNKIVGILMDQFSVPTVSFSFAVFQYDPVSGQFFSALTNSAKFTESLQGTVAKQGTKLLLSVSNVPGTAVANPQNWEVQLSIASAATGQNIQFQSGPGNKLTKSWGLKS